MVVLLGVSFLGEVVNWEGESDVLPLGAAVALVIAALGFILWLTPKQHEPKTHASREPACVWPTTAIRHLMGRP